MVLVWLDEGEDDMEIATRLAIDPAAVPPLVAIAHSKLERLRNSTTTS